VEWGISLVFDKGNNKKLFDFFHENNKEKIPIQRYWTGRYVITLAIGLIVISIISAFWIRHTTFEKRLDMMQFMVEETAKQIVEGNEAKDEDSLLQTIEVRRFLEDPGRYMQMNSDPSIFIVNNNGDIVYDNSPDKSLHRLLNPRLLYDAKKLETFYSKTQNDNLYMVKAPVEIKGTTAGWVVFFELKGNLAEVNQEYKQLFIMVGALAIISLLAIYFLSKQLAKPITDVAEAAELIKEGNYEVQISENVREKEVYELIRSFKEMAIKLEKLENLRTELLAGVTHELKTPVTSISGLLQAIKDGVVEKEEAAEFLDISIQESEKMKKMVEDLLAFNAFATQAMPLDNEIVDVNETTRKIVRDWEITYQHQVIVNIHPTAEPTNITVDYIRLQQILVNLMNNAMHAMDGNNQSKLEIQLKSNQSSSTVFIDVTDSGGGIDIEEQPFIFERFFRGEHKKFQTSGFGLGLPFSKMIAHSMGGDLELLKSTTDGTTFRLTLPITKHH